MVGGWARAAMIAAAVTIAGCASSNPADAPPSLVGTVWVAEDIDGEAVLDRVQSTVEFPGEGRAVGSTACNRFTGPVRIQPDGGIAFTEMATTRRACPPAVMAQEGRFLAALGRAWRYTLAPGDRLALFDADGRRVMLLSRLARPPAAGS